MKSKEQTKKKTIYTTKCNVKWNEVQREKKSFFFVNKMQSDLFEWFQIE